MFHNYWPSRSGAFPLHLLRSLKDENSIESEAGTLDYREYSRYLFKMYSIRSETRTSCDREFLSQHIYDQMCVCSNSSRTKRNALRGNGMTIIT